MVGKFYSLLFAMTISSLLVHAQCNSITLSTQADVDAFPSTRGCTVVAGNLNILGYPTGDITNLDSLYMIEKISGALNIQANVWLTDLTGLSNVTSVGSFFSVTDNSRLFSLEGLHNIESCGGLTVSGGEFYDLSGLRGLTKADQVYLNDLRRITTLDGLQNITSMYSLVVTNNPLLNDLTALRGKSRLITWQLAFKNNASLTSLNGLEDVDIKPTGGLVIQANPALTTLEGLHSYDTLLNILIENNPQLADISPLGSLGEIGEMWIEKNYALTDIGTFPNLTSIHALKIRENTGLNTLEGFSSLTKASFIQIMGSPLLPNLNGFRNITNVDSAFWIGHNHSLTDMTGLESLDSVGYLIVYSNNSLTSLHGLEGLKVIDGSVELPPRRDGLELYQNHALTDITALSGLTEINGDLRIQWCNALTDLHGLEGITKVNGMIQVVENDALETLGALSNVTSIGISPYTYPSGDDMPKSFNVLTNPVLKDLGITKITFMPGALRVRGNAALEDLDDLSALEQVGPNQFGTWDVQFIENPSLVSFCGLYNLVTKSTGVLGLTIADNGAESSAELIEDEGPCDGEPDPEPGELVFTNVTGTTMTVGFAPSDPAPTGGYLLLLRRGTSPYPDFLPVDGTAYNVGQVLGHETIVVGKGTGNQFNVVYLEPSTTYHYALYTFDSNLDYAVSTTILGSQMTTDGSTGPGDPTLPQPTDLVFSDVTDNSMTVSFTASSSADVDGYLTVMRAYGSSYPEDVPADGTAYNVGNVIGSSSIVVGRGTSTSLNIIYLNPDTEYWFDVYSYTSDGSYDYVTTSPLEGMQRTSPVMMAAAYPNPFEESVTIRFNVKEARAHVRVTIFDNMGAPVAELLNGEVGQGMHEVSWTGIDNSGRKASGLYHYTIMGHDSPVRGTVVAK